MDEADEFIAQIGPKRKVLASVLPLLSLMLNDKGLAEVIADSALPSLQEKGKKCGLKECQNTANRGGFCCADHCRESKRRANLR
jgi:hypothetical protein